MLNICLLNIFPYFSFTTWSSNLHVHTSIFSVSLSFSSILIQISGKFLSFHYLFLFVLLVVLIHFIFDLYCTMTVPSTIFRLFHIFLCKTNHFWCFWSGLFHFCYCFVSFLSHRHLLTQVHEEQSKWILCGKRSFLFPGFLKKKLHLN